MRFDRTVSCRDKAENEGTGRGRQRESKRGMGPRAFGLKEVAGGLSEPDLLRVGRREAGRGSREGRAENCPTSPVSVDVLNMLETTSGLTLFGL